MHFDIKHVSSRDEPNGLEGRIVQAITEAVALELATGELSGARFVLIVVDDTDADITTNILDMSRLVKLCRHTANVIAKAKTLPKRVN
jgi:hypothetical protein